jgi:hypothetical protein
MTCLAALLLLPKKRALEAVLEPGEEIELEGEACAVVLFSEEAALLV